MGEGTMKRSMGRTLILASAVPLIALWGCKSEPKTTNAAALPYRSVLPLLEPNHPAITELDIRKATAPPLFQVKAPQGAPNVIVILLDNLGFGATKPFGGA